MLDHAPGGVCFSERNFLYDFDLDGNCEYETIADEDARLIDPEASIDYRFYWSVSDHRGNGDSNTGTWNYQMDNWYAQNPEHGQTSFPAEVVDNVAIFYQSRFGFWPALWYCPGRFTGGLHVLLEPTPGSSWDEDTNCNDEDYVAPWQSRIRARFTVQGLDPDIDGVTGSGWLDCWLGYMDLHRERIAGGDQFDLNSPLGAIRELCGLGRGELFDGYGVVDYEQMYFDWNFQNNIGCGNCVGIGEWESKVEEINSPATDSTFLAFMNGTEWEFTPQWTDSPGQWVNLQNKDELYEKSWNYFMHLLVSETLAACREASQPDAKWGFYAYPKHTINLDGWFSSLATSTNDALGWLWDADDGDGVHVDMLLPSLYAKYATTVDGDGGCVPNQASNRDYTESSHFYRTNVLEMLYLRDTYNSNSLILPYVWRQYRGSAGCSEDVNEYVSLQQFMLPKFYGADGVMIWDAIDRRTWNIGGSPAFRLEALVNGGLWDDIISQETCETP